LDQQYRVEVAKLENEGIPPEEAEGQARNNLKGNFRVINGEEAALLSDQALRRIQKLRIPYPSEDEGSPY
jgi:hypothetical protein